MKSVLVIQTAPPYASQSAELGLDVLTGSTAIFKSVKVLLKGKGLLQLLTNQSPTQQKRFTDLYKALNLYDVEQIYVSESDMITHQLTTADLIVDVIPLPDLAMAELIKQQDLVWVF